MADTQTVHVDERDFHELTWKITQLLRVLVDAEGRLTVAELALRVELHRDTTRRVCRTLTAAGWLAEHVAGDGGLSYSLNTGLIQLVWTWFHRMELAAQRIADLTAAARAPLGLRRAVKVRDLTDPFDSDTAGGDR